ncbi:siderophore-iron reductase FhuF [Rossellomorea marisflavi]|uniref:siderophore-iron reductase FhuF n=1 Tax=Rossellomorea marisflavi TaxID=189381 RepID=UPI003D2EA9B3
MTEAGLGRDQWSLLEKYRFTVHDGEDGTDVASLLDPAELDLYISSRLHMIGTEDCMAAASIFMKRYAFTAAMALMAMTCWNRKMDVNPENMILVDHMKSGLWLPRVHMKNVGMEAFHSNEEKRTYLQNLFQNTIVPIIQAVNSTFNVPEMILWENVAVYIYWVYETDDFFMGEGNESDREEDFRMILSEENAHWFGTCRKNPLNRFFREKSPVDGEMIRVRKTCCFSYRLDGATGKCITCPLQDRTRKES